MIYIPTPFFQQRTEIRIGSFYAGGYVAFITGSFPNLSGFVVDSTVSSRLKWGVSGNDVTGTGEAYGSASINTDIIYNNDPSFNGVAQYCYNLTSSGYTDWALPTKDELVTICSNHNEIPITWPSDWSYFSSTQYSTGYAWWVDVGSNDCVARRITFTKNTELYCIPIRYFTYDPNN